MVLAVDSWVGDLQSWFSEGWRDAMAWQDGQARVYERFLNHVVQAGMSDTILPLRAQSITAARMLYFLNYTVDAIYLDNAQVQMLPSLQPWHAIGTSPEWQSELCLWARLVIQGIRNREQQIAKSCLRALSCGRFCISLLFVRGHGATCRDTHLGNLPLRHCWLKALGTHAGRRGVLLGSELLLGPIETWRSSAWG